jgi:hypothetical protein
MAGIGVAGLAMRAAFLLTPSGGTTTDHFLTKSQARRFVQRYNRALR